MIKIKQNLVLNPLLITFIAVGLWYIIIAIFLPFDSLTTLVVFILIALLSLSISNIVYSLTPGFMSVSERIINIIHSSIILILTTVSLTLSMQKPMFSMTRIMSFLIFSFFIIGVISSILALINTGYPNWFRLTNLLFGIVTLLISLIALTQPLIGYLLLTLIITSFMIIAKTLKKSQ